MFLCGGGVLLEFGLKLHVRRLLLLHAALLLGQNLFPFRALSLNE